MGRFSFSKEVEGFCNTIPLESFLRMEWPKPNFPNELVEIFPLFVVFYREKPGKKRKLNDGWISTKLDNGKYKHTRKKKSFKKGKTADQNNFSVYVHYAHGIGSLGTIRRIAKHKGHGKLVAAYQPNQSEYDLHKYDARHSVIKYKNFHELYLRRKVYEPDFKDLTDRLEQQYKCNATGQVRLF